MKRRRAAGAALVTIGLSALAAGPALADGVTVGSLSTWHPGRPGTLHGRVLNRTGHAARARITVRTQRYGTRARVVGRTSVRVAAGRSAAYRVAVRIPRNLPRGNYYLSACTPDGAGGLRTGTYAKTLTFTLSTTQP